MSTIKRTTMRAGSTFAAPVSPAFTPPVSLAFIAISSLALFTLVSPAIGCRAVKPYQRAYLNDYNMKLGTMDVEKMDENAQAYREGSSGGGGGKASGGCGCN